MSDHCENQEEKVKKNKKKNKTKEKEEIVEINSMEDYYRVLEEVKLELPEAYDEEDGPLLSCVFDDLPADAIDKFECEVNFSFFNLN